MDLVHKIGNPDAFTQNVTMLLNMFVSGYKFCIMWANYEDIATIIKSLTEEPFKPLDSGEMKIRRKFDKQIK